MKLGKFILAMCMLVGCGELLFDHESGSDPEAVFEELWNTFDQEYESFEERNVDWDALYIQYRPLVHAYTSEEELYQVFTEMLRPLNDGHIVLITPDRPVSKSNTYYAQKKEDSLFRKDVIRSNYLTRIWQNGENGNLVGEIGNIAYWHLQWVGENLLETDETLDAFADKEGLIIDLRHNWGGDFTYAITELGRLTDRERLVLRSRTKNGPGQDDYTPWYSWQLAPAQPHFNLPIILLTDRYTISAAERMAMILKTLPNVIHIGDTTNGALSTKIGKELPNGWCYSMAPQQVFFADGVNYEGIGLIPDMQAQSTFEALINNQDEVLALAIEKLKTINHGNEN